MSELKKFSQTWTREADDIKTTVYESQKELKESLKNIMNDCDISVKQEEENR